MSKIEEYAEEFSWLDSDDRLMHLIDLAKNATTLPEALRTEERKVNGCISQIWVDVGVVDDLVQVYYDSDAMITKGITHIICSCFNGMSISAAKKVKRDDFEVLGIAQLLTQQRRNGLGNLIDTIIMKVKKL